MSIISKYAVPFNNRKPACNCNVVNKVILGGVGYLKIELPVNPSINNCIGFKIKVTSDDNKLLFEGHISGSSSDGYSWIYVSSTSINKSDLARISGKPTIFCSQFIDPEKGNEIGNVVRSVLIGDNDTDWGSSVRVNIECLQATLKTSPDGEDNIVTTSDINEYSSMSRVLDESSSDSDITDGWNFKISKLSDENIVMSVTSPIKGVIGDGIHPNVTITGVVSGDTVFEDDGSISVVTSYTGNSISLYDRNTDSYGEIIADGSKLRNLDLNESIKNIEFKSIGFTKPVEVRSSDASDISVNFSLQSGGTLINPTYTVDKVTLGSWTSTNNKCLTIKTSDISGDLSPAFNVNLKSGELGFIHNDTNTDLYIGTGKENILVGGIKICSDAAEFSNLDLVKGRMAMLDNEIFVFDGSSWVTVNFSTKLSMDEILDGYFYEKPNADAILGGEVVRLKWDGGLITGNEIVSHINDSSIHITQDDKDRWNSRLDVDNYYTKSYIDKELNNKADKNHYHGYHNPVNIVVSGDTNFTKHNYPYGHRILVKEYVDKLPVIKIAGYPNEWLEDEEFNLGDKVTVSSDGYIEYMNKANKVVISNSEINTRVYVQTELRDIDPSDLSSLKDGDWFIYKGGYEL